MAAPDPPESAADLPSQAAVIVIGGGIMGCSTLYHLAEMGITDAILLERNQLTSGTTWHSAAQVRALRHSRNLTRMIQYSIDLYSRLEQETGQSVGWIQKGSLSIATNPDRLTHIKRQESLAHAYGIKADGISPAEAQERWPLMNAEDVIGAVWSPEDGRVSPSDVCAALVKAAKSRGARFFENTPVTGIRTEAGRIRAVETPNATIRCDAIALCGGLWSRQLGALAGADVPLLACEHFYLLTRPLPGVTGNMPTLSDHDGHLYIRDDSGGLLVGCFEPRAKPIAPEQLGENFAFRLLPEDWDHFEPMMHNALHRLPALETAEVKMLLNGPESFTPDGTFMLGETAETRGLFLGCGMNSVGVAAAGGAGMNLAHCILHTRPAYDLGEADAQRFAPVFNSIQHLMARAPEVLGTHYDIAYPGKQYQTARDLRRLPLDAAHRANAACMGQFYAWERPLYFGKTREPKLTFARPDWFDNMRAEVMAAHHEAAVFDASPFGKIDVTGADAEAFLLHVCAGHVQRPPGAVIYTAMLNETGTFESDFTAQRLAPDHYRLFVGTAAIRHDLAWLRRHAENFAVQLRDTTEDYAVLALMGPRAAAIAQALGAKNLPAIAYFHHAESRMAGHPVRAARLSYIGEAGWEITCRAPHAADIHAALLAQGARPAGLFAQTSMRIEKGFCAMGHELDGDITPIEAGLLPLTRKHGGFIGHAALQQRQTRPQQRRLTSLALADTEAVPLGHEPILADGRIIGETTSCAFGFRVRRPVALGYVEASLPDGATVQVDIARDLFIADALRGPLFDPYATRMKA